MIVDEVFLVWRRAKFPHLAEESKIVDSIYSSETDAKTKVLELIRLETTLDAYYEPRKVVHSDVD